MLDYDNSAFYYFMISMLAIFLLPGWYYTIKYTIRCLIPTADPALAQARSKLEEKKLRKLKGNASGVQKLRTWGYCFQVGVLVFFTALLMFLVYQVVSDSELARFDPYRILDIDRSATDKQIKRAYKIKALEYHPDKNVGNKNAEQQFMMVAKAYEALTDEASRENWEKYGNPDGKQSLEVSVGLPVFLANPDNAMVILIVYLLAMVVCVPLVVGVWWSHSKRYGDNNILLNTYAYFRHSLNEGSGLKQLPEVLAGASEFISCNQFKDRETYEQVKSLLSVFRGKQLEGFMAKPRQDKIPFIVKGNVILHAHLGRHSLSNLKAPVSLPAEWQGDLDKMLVQSPVLIQAMVDFAYQQRWVQTILNIMHFSQHLTQGLWVKDQHHLQLPHLSPKDVKHMLSGKGGAKDFSEYLKIPHEGKKGLTNLDDRLRADVYAVCDLMPSLEVEVSHFVEDEEEIAEKDTVTLQVKITRKNVPDGEKAKPVHAPHFAGKKEEGWWVMLTAMNDKHVITIERVTDTSKHVTVESKFLAPPQKGTYAFNVHIVSDSYLGLDQVHKFDMKVTSAAELPEYEPHKEDLELDNEVSLFEQMANAQLDSDESSDEEEVEDEKPAEADENLNLTQAEKRKRMKRQALKAKKAEGQKDDDGTSEEEEAPPLEGPSASGVNEAKDDDDEEGELVD